MCAMALKVLNPLYKMLMVLLILQMFSPQILSLGLMEFEEYGITNLLTINKQNCFYALIASRLILWYAQTQVICETLMVIRDLGIQTCTMTLGGSETK